MCSQKNLFYDWLKDRGKLAANIKSQDYQTKEIGTIKNMQLKFTIMMKIIILHLIFTPLFLSSCGYMHGLQTREFAKSKHSKKPEMASCLSRHKNLI
jgi:hypothetical protein